MRAEPDNQADSPPPDTLKGISDFFDDYGDIWRKAYDRDRERWWEYNFLERRERYALHLLLDKPEGTAVDLGCGAGHALIGMKQMGFTRVVGVDVSEAMLAKARETLGDRDLSDEIELLQGDVQDLPAIESGSVDACIALGVIEYLDEDDRFLREIHRLLRPGGVAVVQTRNYCCVNARTFELLRSMLPGIGPKIVYREHRPDLFRASLSRCGFCAEVELYSHFYALYPLNLFPIVRKVIRPLDNCLSKACERFSSHRFSRYLASMHIVKMRKTDDAPG